MARERGRTGGIARGVAKGTVPIDDFRCLTTPKNRFVHFRSAVVFPAMKSQVPPPPAEVGRTVGICLLSAKKVKPLIGGPPEEPLETTFRSAAN